MSRFRYGRITTSITYSLWFKWARVALARAWAVFSAHPRGPSTTFGGPPPYGFATARMGRLHFSSPLSQSDGGVRPEAGRGPHGSTMRNGRQSHIKSARISLVIVALGVSLAACGHSDATHFFTLDPIAPAQPVAAAWVGPPIRLRRVTIPPALDRVELVRETAPGEVKISDFEHWAAPLGQTAVQVLAQDLAARLPAGALIPPAAPLPTGGVDVDVDILAFNVADGQAVMQASWSEISRLSPPPNANRPAPPSSTRLVQLTAPVDASGGLAEAQGLSRLLGQLADRIAADAASPR